MKFLLVKSGSLKCAGFSVFQQVFELLTILARAQLARRQEALGSDSSRCTRACGVPNIMGLHSETRCWLATHWKATVCG
jgi:hypothetical protein